MNWPETTYDAVAAEANASAPARRTTASVRAEDYDGDHPTPNRACGGACWHWQNDVDCPPDPWVCERCGEPLPADPVCVHGAYVCADHIDACPECRYDAAAARADLDARYDRENGAA